MKVISNLIFALVFIWALVAAVVSVASGKFTLFFIISGTLSVFVISALFYESTKPYDVYEEYLEKNRLTDDYLRFKRRWWEGEE